MRSYHKWAGLLLLPMLLLGIMLLISPNTPPINAQSGATLVTVQSDDARVSQSGAWTLTADAVANGGSYLVNTAATDVLTLAFTGTYFEVIFLRGAGYGTFAIEIDNSVVRTVVATDSAASYDQRSVIDYLSDAPHTARIYPVSGAIAIDAIVTVPIWIEAFSSSFDDPISLDWMNGDTVADNVVATSGDAEFHFPAGYTQLRPRMNGVYHGKLEQTVNISTGNWMVVFNESDTGLYWLELTSTGTLTLNRGDVVLQSTTIPAFAATTNYQIDVHYIGSQIQVLVDNTLLLTVTDTNPLPLGHISYVAPTGGVTIDDIRVWRMSTEYNDTAPTFDQSTVPLGVQVVPDDGGVGGNAIPGGDPSIGDNYPIIYTCNQSSPDVCVLDPETGSRSTLPIAVGSGTVATWSPDGTRIAYVIDNTIYLATYQNPTWTTTALYTYVPTQAAGSEIGGQRVEWSPDGEWLLFTRLRYLNPGTSSDIAKVNVADCLSGGCLPYVIGTGKELDSATWSTDGTQIAYIEHMTPSGMGTYYIMSATGGNATSINLESHGATSPLRWSPDGQYLLGAAEIRGGSDSSDVGYLFTVPVSGGNPTALTDTTETTGNQFRYHWLPDWSPDGTQIVFSSWRRYPTPTLELMPSVYAGAPFVQLSAGDWPEYPSWRKSGFVPDPCLGIGGQSGGESGDSGGNSPNCQVDPTDTPTASYTPTATSAPSTLVIPANQAPITEVNCALFITASPAVAVEIYHDPSMINTPAFTISSDELAVYIPLAYWGSKGGSIVYVQFGSGTGRVINGQTTGWIDVNRIVSSGQPGQVPTVAWSSDDVANCEAPLPVNDSSSVGTPTPVPTFGPSPTPTATFTVTPTLTGSQFDAELQTYGVRVIVDMTDTSITQRMEEEVFLGVQAIDDALGQKFTRLSGQYTPFQRVMGVVDSQGQFDPGGQIAVILVDRSNGVPTCLATSSTSDLTDRTLSLIAERSLITSQFNYYIECDISMATPQPPGFSRYTVVHEFGHIFTLRTGGQNQCMDGGSDCITDCRVRLAGNEQEIYECQLPLRSFFGHMNFPKYPIVLTNGQFNGRFAIRDDLRNNVTEYLVQQGNSEDSNFRPQDFNRNSDNTIRGWGSSHVYYAGGFSCDFQQNPVVVGVIQNSDGTWTTNQLQFGYADAPTELTEIDEAAADMFLNWVFERHDGTGFANADWSSASDCTTQYQLYTEPSNSGNSRYEWMEMVMTQIGNGKGWN